jgi:CRISPR type I-E-associated protein CasB/Cse2
MPKRKTNEAFMKQDSIARFISHLETLGGIAPGSNADRRALAALRRSLATSPMPAEAIRVVAPFLPQQATGWWEDVYYIIAALFAMHPCLSGKETGRGPSLAKALDEARSGDSGQGPERRLLAFTRITGLQERGLAHSPSTRGLVLERQEDFHRLRSVDAGPFVVGFR